MAVFDCLSQEANLYGKYLLEASAGTGKTFAIEQIALRLLIEKKDPLLLEEILIVTFTKAAAADVKKRILTNIEKTLGLLEQSKDSFDSFPPYLSYLLAQGQKKEIVRSLQEALLFFDRAQIFTIHGFCARMLQEFAFEAKQPFAASFQESENEEKIMKESFFDILYYEDISKRFSPAQMALLLQRFQEPKRLLRQLKNRRFKESFLSNELLGKMQEAIDQSPIQGKEIIALFDNVFPYFKISTFKKEEILLEVRLLSDLVDKKQMDLDGFLQTGCRLFSFLHPDNKKTKGPSFEELFSRGKNLWYFQDKLYPFLKQTTSSSYVMALLQKQLQERIEKKLEKNELFTFDWILKRMIKALEYQEFVSSIRSKYSAVMIDEFQDTDPMQWEIFRRLFLEDQTLRCFFLVGDPKQSIYRFRKADLYTYYQAAEFLGNKALFFLDTNYRSSPPLVEALNALFSSQTASSWLSLPELKKAIPYHPVKAGLPLETGWKDGKKSVHFFIARPEKNNRQVFTSEELFFSYISQEIERLHIAQNVEYQDIAILVKDRYQQERLKEHLLGKEIPFFAKNQQLLSESDALWAMKEFFYALIFPQEISYLRRALTGPLLGWSFHELTLAFEKRLPEILAQMALLRNVLEKEGLPHFFRSLLTSQWKEDHLSVVERLVSRKDLSFYEETLALFDLLIAHEKKRASEILSFFEEIAEEERAQEGETIRSPEGVQIMTLHASKGLEFSVVFALGLASNSPVIEEDNECFEEDAEKMRQFYVALTRAKKRSYVPFIWGEEREIERGKVSACDLFCSHVLKQKNLLGKISPADFLQQMDRLKEEGHVSYEWIDKILQQDPLKKEKIPLFPPPSIVLPKRPSRFHSFSSITSSEVEKREELYEDENYLFSSQLLPQGKEMGVCVHRIFEKVFSSEKGTTIEQIIEEELWGTCFYKYSRKIQEMVIYALSTPLEIPNQEIAGNVFCLKDIDKKNLFAEMEFLYSLSPSLDVMKGSIDLLFLYEGKYYFVDWKTNWLGDRLDLYQPQCLKKSMEEHRYFLQASIYKEAVERFVGIIGDTYSFGGAFYVFLRGVSPEKKKNQGVFAFLPEKLHQDSSLCLQIPLV